MADLDYTDIDNFMLEVINNINDNNYDGTPAKVLAILYSIMAYAYHIAEDTNRIVVISDDITPESIVHRLTTTLTRDKQTFSNTHTTISILDRPLIECFSIDTVLLYGLPAEDHDYVFFVLNNEHADSEMVDLLNECVINATDNTDIREIFIGITDADLESFI